MVECNYKIHIYIFGNSPCTNQDNFGQHRMKEVDVLLRITYPGCFNPSVQIFSLMCLYFMFDQKPNLIITLSVVMVI